MKTLADFEPLNSAELKLLEASITGQPALIARDRPTRAITEVTNTNIVRSSFIRWLALGGDTANELHTHGIHLIGAWIEEKIDLMGATLETSLFLNRCHFVEAPNIRFMQINGNLAFDGCKFCNGLDADGVKTKGYMSFQSEQNQRFESLGQISLLGANIGDSLIFNGSALSVPPGVPAITGDGLRVGGGAFFTTDENYRFQSTGEIRMLGVSIEKNLSCLGANLDVIPGSYALSLDNARIEGVLSLRNYKQFPFSCSGKIELISSEVKAGLQLYGLNPPLNSIDLSNSKLGFLQSDLNAWGSDIDLDGFTYETLRSADWQTGDYLNWLSKQRIDHFGTKENPLQFKPQPWQQLISVLRKMGHDDQARDIAIAFEKRRYDIGKIKGLAKPLHWVFGKLAGYGYKPLNLVGWMLAIWLSFAACFWWAAYQGVFTPSDPLVFQNAAYDTCRSVDAEGKSRAINNSEPDGKTNNWYTCSKLMGEYTTFSPLTYSLDVILPLVDLGQEKTWGTYIDTAKPNAVHELIAFTPNHIIRLMVWLEILFGWMASLMLVAVLTGLTDRNKQ